MANNKTRGANGMYNVSGRSFSMLIGTRAQVWHGTAYKTSGGLTKSDLMQNKAGRIVSKAKHATAKREMRLVKAGYGTKKGKFGFVRMGKKSRRKGKGSKKRGGVIVGGGMTMLDPEAIDGSVDMREYGPAVFNGERY